MFSSKLFVQNSEAIPKPQIAGMFSVPDLKSLSCPPPVIIGDIFRPFRIYSAPTPFGPCIL